MWCSAGADVCAVQVLKWCSAGAEVVQCSAVQCSAGVCAVQC